MTAETDATTLTPPKVTHITGGPRILVTGARDWRNRGKVATALLKAWMDLGQGHDIVLVHGACPTGADQIARELWTGWGLKEEPHPAQWALHGKAAGPIRNQEMVDLGADICLAFPLPGSRGTTHCMAAAVAAGIPLCVIEGGR